MMALLSLWIGVSLIGGQYALASTNQPPEGAKDFAEQHFHQIVEEVVFSDSPSEWGFKEEKGTITFSELYPIYSLNADFALGQSDDIITDKQPKWVAVIFQDDQPVNAAGTQQTADGHFELAAIGYPPELPNGLLNLKDNEILVHDFPAEEYYVYSEKTNSLMKLEQLDGKYSLSNLQSKEQFQNMLMERYKNIDEWEEDSSGGFMSAAPSQSSPSYAFIYPVLIIVVLGGAWLYFRRRLKTRN
ncbi:hypothetical protein ACF3MZ_18125 [Paenibacillaceae bacterium WGS1546]|uniref:hypothetical protein n=1 Tax=Cohnella sp. WGS1546 TaxID=3366810 RepID=UPI00372D551E